MANMRLLLGKVLRLGNVRHGAGAWPPGPAAPVAARDKVLIQGCIVAVMALAWAYLFYLDGQILPGTPEEAMAAHCAPADVGLGFLMWSVMMVGMMAGSAMPAILLFAGAQARRGKAALWTHSFLFGSGYALVWIGFSAVAALAQAALHNAALLSPAMAASSTPLSAAILCMAGIYQLSPFKQACLAHCRSPLGFFLAHWRVGRLGAIRMGVRHGAYCLGCCWALMLVLFVVGAMNLAWVAALALLVLLEKTGPAGMLAARLAGIALVGWGLALLAGA